MVWVAGRYTAIPPSFCGLARNRVKLDAPPDPTEWAALI